MDPLPPGRPPPPTILKPRINGLKIIDGLITRGKGVTGPPPRLATPSPAILKTRISGLEKINGLITPERGLVALFGVLLALWRGLEAPFAGGGYNF